MISILTQGEHTYLVYQVVQKLVNKSLALLQNTVLV